MREVSATSGVEVKKLGWTKARAVLAGGLVLGVGAAITLATWTDNEWATGIFGTGTFGIAGSTDGTLFTENPTTGAAAPLDFQVGADDLTPGDTVYAGYAVQLIAGSTSEATVTVASDTTSAITGTEANYVYTTSATCDSGAYANGANANGATFTLTAPETPVYLCFEVTANSTLEQGASGSITWTFDAVSGDPIV